MILTRDQQQVKMLLTETVTLLCKNGLSFDSEITIEALIGITIDKKDVFLININETVKVPTDRQSCRSSTLDTNNDGPKETPENVFTQTPAKRSRLRRDIDSSASQDSSWTSSVCESSSKKTSKLGINSGFDQLCADTSCIVGNISCVSSGSAYSTFGSPVDTITGRLGIKGNTVDSESCMKLVQVNEDCDYVGGYGLKKGHIVVDKDDDMDSEAPNPVYMERLKDYHKTEDGTTCHTAVDMHSSFGDDVATRIKEEPLCSDNEEMQPPPVTCSIPSDMTATLGTTDNCGPYILSCVGSSNTPQQNPAAFQSSSRGGSVNTKSGKQIKRVKGGKLIRCRHCSKILSTKNGLKLHERQHSGIYAYTCRICGKGCSSTSNLRGHMASAHTHVREFCCAVCGREYSYKNSLVSHMKEFHPEVVFDGSE